MKQAAPFDPLSLLSHRADDLEHPDDDHVLVTTHKRTQIRCRAVIIAGGIGTFTPRPLPDSEDWEGRGRKVLVDTTMATSLPRVFATGDITSHEGKVDLIAVGFGQVRSRSTTPRPSSIPRRGCPRPLVRSAQTMVAQRLAMVADTPSPWSRRPWNH